MDEELASSTWLEERRLHERVLAREASAMADLYDQFSPTVFGVALRVTSSRDGAEDVTQSVFLDVWRHPERFHPDRGSLRAWLATIAHHRSVDYLRHQAVRRRDTETQTRPQSPPDAEEIVVGLWAAERVRSELAKLPEAERTPINLAYFNGQSYREVAASLGVPEGTIKSRIRSGLRHLATGLQTEIGGFGF